MLSRSPSHIPYNLFANAAYRQIGWMTVFRWEIDFPGRALLRIEGG